MSATAAADAGSAPKAKGKSKLLLILIVLLVLLGAGGAGAFYIMKKNVAAAAGDEDDVGVAKAAAPNRGQPPTYVALDPFVVNLADKESERYAQIAVTLQVDDPKFAEQMKGYMPSIRNGILLVLAHKTSRELLERAGKDALAEEIMREAVRPMGIEIDPEDAAEEAEQSSKKKRKKRRAQVHNPVTHVHFANFIIQ
ncbi:flagellar basal body-associated FliL family protein [Piscinibacter sakaiensis]|uniref:flagellar basal body-associated FliL family protein n=1 Tax=Piscinibacter sakaiensis TaxID=1547922 RepID=UPI003AACE53D